MINDLVTSNQLIETGSIADVPFHEIKKALERPRHNWKRLLRVSETLMRISPHYYRLNTLFSNAALFNWGVDLYDVKDSVDVNQLKKGYNSLVFKLENMNLKHEFNKIMRIVPYQDIFCGLVMENQSDFFVQQISPYICELYQIQDGIFNFKMDLSSIDVRKLNAYPDYVRKAHEDYRQGNIGCWYMPPAGKQICTKFNYQWNYPYPFLLSLCGDIFDLDIYKKLNLQSTRTDNYKAIMVEVPMKKDSVDSPLISQEVLGTFAEINRANMTDDIGIIHTLGAKGEAVSFKDSSNTRNNVSDATDNIYDGSGITQELFNGSSSATAVSYSVENTSGYIYSIYRQLERWVNRYIKLKRYNKPNYKFKFYLLDSTVFNRDEVSQRYKDACSLGLTVVDKFLASLGMTPSVTLGSYVLNKSVFDFENNLLALSSIYNANSNEGSVGRPTNEEKGELLGDSGEITADTDANSDR